MPAFTVQTLIDRAAVIADMHDDFVKPEQWLSWFNTERRALSVFMATHGGSTRNMQFLTKTGVDLEPLASLGAGDFIAVVGVWEKQSTGQLRPLRLVEFVDNYNQDTGGNITGPAQTVSIEESINDGTEVAVSLRFFPRDQTGTYFIVLLAGPPDVISVGGTASFPMGLEERVVVGMARRALVKEESDTTEVLKMIKEQDQLVEEYCWNRSVAQGKSVRNVDRLQRGWQHMDNLVLPGSELWLWF